MRVQFVDRSVDIASNRKLGMSVNCVVIDNGVFAGAIRGRYHYYDDIAILPVTR